jgi:hypothetical protein
LQHFWLQDVDLALLGPPSLQVSLVLEYCDWGCLRDALDAGAFFARELNLS